MPAISTPDILRVFDPVTYARGLDYARQQRVSSVSWHPEAGELFGRVAGQSRQRYTTRIRCKVNGTSLTVLGSTCSCPVGESCKHVVALLITAQQMPDAGQGAASAVLHLGSAGWTSCWPPAPGRAPLPLPGWTRWV